MKAPFELLWKFLLATMLVMVGSMLAGGLAFALLGNPWADSPAPADVFLPMLFSSALLVLALIAPVRMSALPRWRRVGAVFLACFGVNVLLMQVEAAAFLDLSPRQLAAAMLQATLAAGWLSLVTGLLFGSREGATHAPEILDWRRWRRRLAAAAFAYLLLYLVAGMLIYPQVAAYYDSQGFEAGPWILPLALVRGALYVVFSTWLIRSMRCTRLQCALAIGLMFPVLAGLAALVIPSGIMPAEVRLWHALEIGWSNFIFGLLVGWLFSPAADIASGSVAHHVRAIRPDDVPAGRDASSG